MLTPYQYWSRTTAPLALRVRSYHYPPPTRHPRPQAGPDIPAAGGCPAGCGDRLLSAQVQRISTAGGLDDVLTDGDPMEVGVEQFRDFI
ncbi:hypothetical protein [Deinococcus sp. AJ005]|uniref:hypothetical protein n=1 Tax=Deinococcus sp. AJ005 TaxID=2652443 RepID=UPI00125CABBA|nr:hypothetical protein [Deinococcus sp. AJ005]QFP75339.1 hypothetical protein DAAJ005_02025 [Deinococcus sp. AJ005]